MANHKSITAAYTALLAASPCKGAVTTRGGKPQWVRLYCPTTAGYYLAMPVATLLSSGVPQGPAGAPLTPCNPAKGSAAVTALQGQVAALQAQLAAAAKAAG